MAYIGNQPTSVAFLTDQFSGNGSTTAFTLSAAPANTNSILVAISGVLQDPSTYSISGTTLTFSPAPPTGTGNISVRFLGIPASGVTTTAYRTQTEFTATAGQTTFTVPSYTVGYIDVYRNGVLLGSADFTATSGTTVVLAAGASAGDLVETVSFYVSSVLNAIPATNGAVTSAYLLDGSVTSAKLATPPTTQTYNTPGSATWTKPAIATFVLIEIWGGGGSGGKGTANGPAGGGGGGAYNSLLVRLADLQGTVTYTVGAGGAAQTTASTSGNNGGTSSVTMGTYAGGGDKTLSAFGGAGGTYSVSGGTGGGGGGIFSAGSGGDGGSPLPGAAAGGANGGDSTYGGAAGGAGDSTSYRGGNSVYGGAGGGGGRDAAGSATVNIGGNSLYGGGGGGGAANSVTGGNAGTSIYGGNGSAGTFDATASSAGTAPAGGSGGTEGGDSGAGGGGRVQFTYW